MSAFRAAHSNGLNGNHKGRFGTAGFVGGSLLVAIVRKGAQESDGARGGQRSIRCARLLAESRSVYCFTDSGRERSELNRGSKLAFHSGID